MSGATLSVALQNLAYTAGFSAIRWFRSIPHPDRKDKAVMTKQCRETLIEPLQRIACP